MVGFISLIILAKYLSTNNAFPPFKGIDMKELFTGTSTIAIQTSLGNIDAEVVDTIALRERGLSGRISMPPNRGMLFVFDSPGMYGFWMKDMHIPLDMIWIDADHKVVSTNLEVATTTYPDMYFPTENAQYILELNAGAATEYGIKIGDTLNFILK